MADVRLVRCARGHSQEMSDLHYFDHKSPTAGHESPGDRARLEGWTSGVSENIARGQKTAEAAMSSWRHSSGHHRNILGRGWTHLGVGLSADGLFWTQNFSTGNPNPPAPPPKKKPSPPRTK
jgi:uncharacterized protein YkwD